MTKINKFYRENVLVEKWEDFVDDMIADKRVTPKDVAEFVSFVQDYLDMLREQADVKRHL